MKKIGCFLFCAMTFFLNAQDTIYKRTGEVVAVKVLEVNIKEISYKRMDLLEGPLMIVSKNEIKKIRYASGSIDSFVVFKEPLKIPPVVYQVPMYVLSNPNLIKSSIRRGVYIYQNQTLSDRNLISLAKQKNLLWNNKEIDEEIQLCKRNRSVQYVVGYSGAAIGIVGLCSSFLAVNGTSGQDNVLFIMTAASAAMGILISSQIVFFSYKLKRVKHSDKVMELYNRFSEK